MKQAWLDEGDVTVNKVSFEFFQELIKFKVDNELLCLKWIINKGKNQNENN